MAAMRPSRMAPSAHEAHSAVYSPRRPAMRDARPRHVTHRRSPLAIRRCIERICAMTVSRASPTKRAALAHRLLDAAEPKIPRRRFHDLRHSAASLMNAAGVELVEVSQLLGHSELRVTADLYAHLQKQTAAKAASIIDAVLSR